MFFFPYFLHLTTNSQTHTHTHYTFFTHFVFVDVLEILSKNNFRWKKNRKKIYYITLYVFFLLLLFSLFLFGTLTGKNKIMEMKWQLTRWIQSVCVCIFFFFLNMLFNNNYLRDKNRRENLNRSKEFELPSKCIEFLKFFYFAFKLAVGELYDS